ncbi:MAG: YifB family Mg chelatase-like AAA ATPase [Chloroflexi bacterium]|nr:YifB family Mg chelatase-like AAA ATPase [Chloroflexota bacterium]
MLARIFACAIQGLDGVIVEVEVDLANGLPGVIIVGLPDTAVQESRERVQSAIKNSGLIFPRKHVRVNLAPASVRKEGPSYDLPIAVGILAASDQIPLATLTDVLVIGELSLDGSVRHVCGVLPMAAMALEKGFRRVFVPQADAAEAALIPGLQVVPIRDLAQLCSFLNGSSDIPLQKKTQNTTDPAWQLTDFREIKGQEHVKRALEIAAAGGHNILMIGPPGAGKTLLARALPAILPSMTIRESLDVTRIYSVADLLPRDIPLIQTRPFRAPHHTISHAGLVGGGNWPHPGEISLAHRGVLFLDELPEFSKQVLEVLRQPLEDKVVTISRARGSLTFPANFQLVAAMNPCPCGYYGDPSHPCTCSPSNITKYQKRISGPLLDRIDIHIQVPRVEYQKLSDDRLGESSMVIRTRVETARLLQQERFRIHDGNDHHEKIFSNADMKNVDTRRYCVLDEESRKLMESAMRQMQLTARAYFRILKLARTIADLASKEQIDSVHLAEALQYRPQMLYL